MKQCAFSKYTNNIKNASKLNQLYFRFRYKLSFYTAWSLEKKLHAREGGFEEYFRCFHYVNLINLIFSAWFSPSPPTPTPLDRCMILKQQWIEIYTIYVFGSKYRKQFLKIKDDSKTPLREKKTQEEGFNRNV